MSLESTAELPLGPGKKIDPNDLAVALGPEGLREKALALQQQAFADARADLGIFTLAEARTKFGDQLPPAVVEGLLREGEILNVIASPKTGKSFLVNSLALAVASGRPWLSDAWRCELGPAIIIDGELPPAVLVNRLGAVRKALGLPLDAEARVSIWTRWGTPPAPAVDGLPVSPLAELSGGLPWVRALKPKIVIIDPAYMLLPAGSSENDNAMIGRFYRDLNALAASCPGAAVALVHHTSKGLQGEKDVTDTGAGAGAFSRGAATHLVLREHKVPGIYVVEGRCRTWPSPTPRTFRFTFPIWTPTAHDPAELKGKRLTCAQTPEELTDTAFADLLTAEPKSAQSVISTMRDRLRYSKNGAERLVQAICHRHGLPLLPAGEEKDCGAFMATNGGKGSGYRFRLKHAEGGGK